MRIRVVLELDVDPCEEGTSLESLGMEQVRDSVAEAIQNAMSYAEGEGHNHNLEDDISILCSAIHVLED